ncbi:hypothetical protein EYF80_014833 [Liparis tanakae]|uniref:Transmembrane protein TMEM132 cohesin-like domain-containing protein n=1 Tax=Liparis tanakae TaxID=230148 RepID=A0A4Z2IBT7_9TELE|nr:hypothetical protein EYF80_014833 [Liparis tanakae]
MQRQKKSLRRMRDGEMQVGTAEEAQSDGNTGKEVEEDERKEEALLKGIQCDSLNALYCQELALHHTVEAWTCWFSSYAGVWFQSGINFLAVKPSNLVAWEIKQEMAPGSSSLAVMCQRRATSTAERIHQLVCKARHDLSPLEFTPPSNYSKNVNHGPPGPIAAV